MAKICAECTYLDLSTGDIYGKFYCDKRWNRHLATDVECPSFCNAYSRDNSTIENAIEFSNDHTTSGCYLTTMLCHILKMSDDNYYLEIIRSFRKNILQKDNKYKELLVEYDIIGPKIAEALANDPLKEKISTLYFNKYIIPITNHIKSYEYNAAINMYKDMTNSLKIFYNLSELFITYEDIYNADINESGHGIYKIKELAK